VPHFKVAVLTVARTLRDRRKSRAQGSSGCQLKVEERLKCNLDPLGFWARNSVGTRRDENLLSVTHRPIRGGILEMGGVERMLCIIREETNACLMQRKGVVGQ